MPIRRYQLIFTIIISLFLVFFLTAKKETQAAWYVDGNGYLINQQTGEVLGIVYAKEGEEEKREDKKEEKKEERKEEKKEESKSDSSGSGGNSGSDSRGSSGGSGGSSSGSGSGSSGGSGGSSSGRSSSGGSGSSGKMTTQSTNIPPTAVPTVKEEDNREGDFEEALELDDVEQDQEEKENQGVRTKVDEGETEIIFGEGEKIRTRTRDGETRTDIYSGGVKVRIEQKEGRLVIKAENEAGEEVGLGEQELFKIEERIDKNIVKVATGSGNSLVFSRGTFAAKTNFPLSVDLATNSLIVQTPAGTKTVAILPDQAITNMLAANVIDRLGTAPVLEALEATGSGRLTGVAGVVELGVRNNVPVYEIAGLSDQKLLGFVPVSIPTRVTVSAETGEILSTQRSLMANLLDFFSF